MDDSIHLSQSQAAAGRVVQTASQPSEMSCSPQQEADRDLSGTMVQELAVELLAKIALFSLTRVTHH